MSFFARVFGFAWGAAPQTPFAAGIAALDRRRFTEALAHFAVALDEAATAAARAAVHNKVGITHVQSGDRAAAIDAFVDALFADALYVPAIVNVGNLLFEDGAVDEAIAHYEAALRIDDAYPTAHLNLGIAYKRLGRRRDAVREFRRASRLEAHVGNGSARAGTR